MPARWFRLKSIWRQVSTKVLKAFTAHDVGKAVNPDGVIGQIQGGFAQGMGNALYEDLKLRNGKIVSDNFNTYIIPTIHEVPPELVIDIVEDPFREGPYGAKGIGEPSLMPVPGFCGNAVSMAIGNELENTGHARVCVGSHEEKTIENTIEYIKNLTGGYNE